MSTVVNLELPQDILDATRLTPQELKVELALTLYAQNRLALGKARELAGLSLWEFRQLLAARRGLRIPGKTIQGCTPWLTSRSHRAMFYGRRILVSIMPAHV